MSEVPSLSSEPRDPSRYAKVTHKPSTVHICITDRCNLSCRHCDIWKLPARDELSFETWKGIIDNFERWLGPFTLKFAGGEPLVRKETIQLTRYCRDKGITVGINTNGTLIDKKLAKELIAADLNEANISLDGCDPDIHDFVRNRKGTFDRVKRAIGHLKGANSNFQLNLAIIICKQNLDNLIELLDWGKANGVNIVTFQALFQNFGATYDPAWFEESDLFPHDTERLNAVFEKIYEYKMHRGFVSNPLLQLSLMRAFFNNPYIHCGQECRAGMSDVGVDAAGNMLLCFNLKSIGNLTEADPADLYTSELAARRREEISSCRRSCSLLNCNFAR